MVTQVNTDNPENLTQDQLDAQQREREAADAAKVTPPAPEEGKLFAGKYKTVEELEEGYGNSDKEATRMAQEISNLKTQLQQAQTPAEKKDVAEKVTDLAKHFDPETARVITSFVANAVEQSKNATTEQNTFAKDVSDNWEETKKLYPDAADPKSKLSIRANEILTERKLAQRDSAGNVQLLTPFAYRIAVEAASLELSKQPPPSAKKGKVGAIQGKGSISVPQGKLTYEQYQALPSDEARDAYDASQVGK